MYFKEKEDTNIDAEFNKNKKNGFDFKKINFKPIIFIAIGLIVLIIIIFLFSTLNKTSKDNYTIELAGEKNIIVNQGTEYVEPGYTAYDSKGNNVTNQVEITSTVDTTKTGTYEILYSIGRTDALRYVTVVESFDATYIYLNGKINMTLEVGEKYVEPGWQVFDSVDQNLDEKVEVTGSVNTSKVGTYQITYTVTNSRNHTTTVKRTISVVAKK